VRAGLGWETEGKNHLEYIGVEVRIILKWIFQKLDGEAGLD
jgi:hypothetical protein